MFKINTINLLPPTVFFFIELNITRSREQNNNTVKCFEVIIFERKKK